METIVGESLKVFIGAGVAGMVGLILFYFIREYFKLQNKREDNQASKDKFHNEELKRLSDNVKDLTISMLEYAATTTQNTAEIRNIIKESTENYVKISNKTEKIMDHINDLEKTVLRGCEADDKGRVKTF